MAGDSTPHRPIPNSYRVIPGRLAARECPGEVDLSQAAPTAHATLASVQSCKNLLSSWGRIGWRSISHITSPPQRDSAFRRQDPKDAAVTPRACSPQQATELSVLIPQVCANPLLTDKNGPSGGIASPLQLVPQQATEPSTLTPQLCPPPALTEVNCPSGGMAWPYLSLPQQTTEPSTLTPQV